uniref:Uncharacterized protein n=1 Tax=Lactuca sativa TaxID=4236 RepID=A0A9R1WUX9_LACSA|nr:hypothetical protein LSAT_V11C900467100 [Lactuca sativa]
MSGTKTNRKDAFWKRMLLKKTIEFFSEYHKNKHTVGIPHDKNNTTDNDAYALSAAYSSEVCTKLFIKAHFFVLQNTPEVYLYIERHKIHLKNKHPMKRQALLEKEHNEAFSHWLKVEREMMIDIHNISEDLRWVSHVLQHVVMKYTLYHINGYVFCIQSREGIFNQNSGVCVESTDTHISRKEEVTYDNTFYYGALQEIWVVDYHIRKKKNHIFNCDWVHNK